MQCQSDKVAVSYALGVRTGWLFRTFTVFANYMIGSHGLYEQVQAYKPSECVIFEPQSLRQFSCRAVLSKLGPRAPLHCLVQCIYQISNAI